MPASLRCTHVSLALIDGCGTNDSSLPHSNASLIEMRDTDVTIVSLTRFGPKSAALLA